MEEKNIYKKALGRFIIMVTVMFAALFGSAGTLDWWNGWVFIASNIVVCTVLTGAVFKKSPELLKERMSAGSQAKSWDRVLVPIQAMVLPLMSVVVAGLDRRYGWTSCITPFESGLALLLMLSGVLLTYLAMRENRFFSSHVRIQTDRGHTVVSTGPYGYVRHPGYSGALVFNIGAPVLLGSVPALYVGAAFVALTVFRTALEDSTLRKELPGYVDYAGKVRWRLVPFVW